MNNKFSIFGLSGVMILSIIASSTLALMVISVLFSFDSLYSSDYNHALPLVKQNTSGLVSVLDSFVSFMTFHPMIFLIAGGVVILIAIFFAVMLFRQNLCSNLKMSSLVLIIISSIALFMIINMIQYFDGVFMFYFLDLDRFVVIKTIMTTFILPGAGILGLAYILFTNMMKSVKVAMVIIYGVVFLGTTFVFTESIKYMVIDNDFNKILTEIDGIQESASEFSEKPYSILGQSFRFNNVTFSPEVKGPVLSEHNVRVLKKYVEGKPHTILRAEIDNYILNYYLFAESVNEYKSYVLGRYLKEQTYYNYLALYKVIATYADPENLADKLEQVYDPEKNTISAVAYGFLAVLFDENDQLKKSANYFDLYKKAPKKRYLNEKIIPIIEKFMNRKEKKTIVSGRLRTKEGPLANVKVMIIDKMKADKIFISGSSASVNYSDTFISAIFDETRTGEQGQFQLKTYSCRPIYFVIEGKYSKHLSDHAYNLLNTYDCTQKLDLDKIQVLPF